MPKTAEILTIGLWQEAIFADYAVPAARVKAAEKLWAVGIVSREDQHGQEYSYETPGWQHACETEAEARDWAEKLLHSWDGGTWITSVQLNHGSKLVETIVRPLVKCGDYVAPSGNELFRRFGI